MVKSERFTIIEQNCESFQHHANGTTFYDKANAAPVPKPTTRVNSNKKPRVFTRNVVHLRGAALRLTGYRVFDIFTALGR
ncbi:hypothetical protein, partial [Vibrio vulnificus]